MQQKYKTVSVAMALYNGATYLEEQLASIVGQTRNVDELIACDDGSTDNTQQIFEKFVNEHGLTGVWKYYKNTENKGPMINFIECAKLCTGDIIFFCDQDDIWDKNKVFEMKEILVNNKDAIVVSCSEKYMDSNGNIMEGKSKLHKNKDKKIEYEKISFTQQVSTMYSPGLTLAFKKDFINVTAPLTYKEGLTYDITMGLVAAAKSGMYRLYKPYVLRRIHGNNASSPKFSLKDRAEDYDMHIKGRKLQLKHMETINKYYYNDLNAQDRKNLADRIQFTRKTIEYLENYCVLRLLLQCFSKNPMDNKKLNIANFLIAIRARMIRGKMNGNSIK